MNRQLQGLQRVGVDISVLQGGSAKRGMGQYTLQQIDGVTKRIPHCIFFLFHQATSNMDFLPDDLKQRPNIHLVALNFPEAGLLAGEYDVADERLYTDRLQDLVIDLDIQVFHITCLDDSAQYYVPRHWAACQLVITVYDLIPFHHPGHYLTNPTLREVYLRGLELLKQADALITISETTAQDLVTSFGIPEGHLLIAPPHAAARFSLSSRSDTHDLANITKPYLMTVSGFNHNKNLENLLRGFAHVEKDLRDRYDFVILAMRGDRLPDHVQGLVEELSLKDNLVWPGRLSDEQVVRLYQNATVYLHVSRIEGFGMPILEAMQCGIPTIVSNRGAMREVAGSAALVVDPESPTSIASAITQLLRSPDLQGTLREAGLKRAAIYSSELLSSKTFDAYYDALQTGKPAIAMWSPLPPQRSGISDYTLELVEELANYYRITLFTAPRYDALPPDYPEDVSIFPYDAYNRGDKTAANRFLLHVYHMGNNTLNSEIYSQLRDTPGLTVIHDLSLFGFFQQYYDSDFDRQFAYSEGQKALAAFKTMITGRNRDDLDLMRFPMLRQVVESSKGIITHSKFGKELIEQKYNAHTAFHVYSGCTLTTDILTKDTLGYASDSFVLGVFGHVSWIKRIDVVIQAFHQLSKIYNHVHLVIVGRDQVDPLFTKSVHELIEKNNIGHVVKFTGEVSLETLNAFVQVVDLVINLRWPTAGETSATMMRAFGAGKVVITSDLPQTRDYPEEFCWRIPIGKAREVTALVGRMRDAIEHPELLVRGKSAAFEFINQHANWKVVAEQYRHAIQQTLKEVSNHTNLTTFPGLTVITDLKNDSGMGQAHRMLVKCMQSSGISPLGYLEYNFDPSAHNADIDLSIPATTYPVNCWLLNPPQFFEAVVHLGEDTFKGRYNIAYWYYELPHFPREWIDLANVLDEIWVATTYVQKNLQRFVDTPVYVIPPPLHFEVSIDYDRGYFNLPTDRYVFMFSFSATASSARKNPMAVISAFKQAFADEPSPPLLVMKVQYLERFPKLERAIKSELKDIPHKLIMSNLSRDEMYSLIQCCDCYISLHRAEGLGLGMAEAMFLCKPVIGTGWSGNVDFMNNENSYMVDCEIVPISIQQHHHQESHAVLYSPGKSHWADPRIDHAASLMRFVYNHDDEARAKGRAASNFIRMNYSSDAIGRQLRRRLKAINWTQPHSSLTQLTPTKDVSTFTSSTFEETDKEFDMQQERRHYQQAHDQYLLDEWNAVRHRDLNRIFHRIPGLSFIIKTLVRIRNLGRMWGAQSHLLQGLLDHNAQLDEAVNALHQRLQQVDASLSQQTETNHHLRGEVDHLTQINQNLQASLSQQTETNHHLRGEVDHLTQINQNLQATEAILSQRIATIHEESTRKSNALQIDLNHNQSDLMTLNALVDRLHEQIATSTSTIENLQAMTTQLGQTQERVRDEQSSVITRQNDMHAMQRLHTSYLRYVMRDDDSWQHDSMIPLSSADVVRALAYVEQRVPEVSDQSTIDISIQDSNGDDLIAELARTFGTRLQPIMPFIWCHIDFSAHWNRPILFQNALNNLQTNGYFVLISGTEFTQSELPDGLVYVLSTQDGPQSEEIFIHVFQKQQ